MIEIMPYIITYTCIWWFLFFISLPIAIREKIITDNKDQFKKEVTKAHIWLKILIVTILSLPLTYFAKVWFDQILLDML